MLSFCSICEINMSDAPKARQELICYISLPKNRVPYVSQLFKFSHDWSSEYLIWVVMEVRNDPESITNSKNLDFMLWHSQQQCWWINQNFLHALDGHIWQGWWHKTTLALNLWHYLLKKSSSPDVRWFFTEAPVFISIKEQITFSNAKMQFATIDDKLKM